MSRILVTGATGRLGTNVVARLLERGEEVRCMVMPGDPLAGKLDGMDTEVFEASLTDTEKLRSAVKGMNVVMHFAAIMDEVPAGMSHETYFDINARGSFVLMDAAHDEGAEKFIYTSSTATYDVLTFTESPIREDAELRPHSEYGVTKVAAEGALMSMAFLYELPLIVIRPSYIMACDQVMILGKPGPVLAGLRCAKEPWCGFHDPSVSADELEALAKQVEEKAGANPDLSFIPLNPDGESWHWHVTDVRDVVQLILRGLDDRSVKRGIFNCAGPRPTNIREAVRHKCERLGTPCEEVETPIDWQLIMDISRAKEALGYAPEYDALRMIDDAIAFGAGKDIGVIPA